MNEILFALFVFCCLTGASLGTLLIYGKLPAHHRQDDTQNVVRRIANIFAVMTSLVPGLMINSGKGRFDGINRDVHTFEMRRWLAKCADRLSRGRRRGLRRRYFRSGAGAQSSPRAARTLAKVALKYSSRSRLNRS